MTEAYEEKERLEGRKESLEEEVVVAKEEAKAAYARYLLISFRKSTPP